MRSIEVNLQLKVQDLHESPDLVLLHGWGVNSGVFTGLVQALQAQHRIRLIDLPGFGQNNHIDIVPLNFSEYCQQVSHCIPHGAALAGWSLGGLVAQQIALQENTPVTKLVCICSSPYFMQESEWPGIKPEILEGFQSQLQQDFMKTLERFLAIQAMGSATAKADLKTIRAQVQGGGVASPEALEKGLWFLQNVDLRSQLAALNVDTLRIFGSQDSLVPKKSLKAIEALQSSARYHTIEKASHAPFISHTDQFTAILRDFLTDF